MQKEKCLIVSHLNIEDLLTINGIVRYYSTKYLTTYILCKRDNLKSVVQIYLDDKSIIPIAINTADYFIPRDHYIYDLYENDTDIIKIGVHNDNWYTLKSNLVVGDFPYLFFKTFYQQLDLDYKIRYKYEKINRNHYEETELYNKYCNKYPNQYIFSNVSIDSNFNSNLPIFDPQSNNYHDNIINYAYIIENAYEIHLTFSSFFIISLFLDLSKVKKKCVYTNIINIKDYHKNIDDWITVFN